jgi:prepilin-type N-terminal cleavage/methylation domain-containing protein
MLNIRHIYLQNKGFTLLEVLLALGISSIIILSFLSILDFSIDACALGDEKDELILNGRYAIEYIKDDIKSADKIISSDKIAGLKTKFPTNIGFVIMIDEENGNYRYITYHLSKNKLVRMACTRNNGVYPSSYYFDGYNDLCEYVDNISNTKMEIELNMVFLDFKFNKNESELDLSSSIFIRCPIDY